MILFLQMIDFKYFVIFFKKCIWFSFWMCQRMGFVTIKPRTIIWKGKKQFRHFSKIVKIRQNDRDSVTIFRDRIHYPPEVPHVITKTMPTRNWKHT